jgi:hypothetical protein
VANDTFLRAPVGVHRQISGEAIRSHTGSYVDRQQRYDARARRRDGDWSVLGVPTALLWVIAEDDLEQEIEWP